MELISYKSLGDIKFSDTFEIVKKKILNKEHVISEQKFLGKTNKTIYLEKHEILIVFKDNIDQVDYFEINKGEFIHLGRELIKLKYEQLFSIYSLLDEDLILKEDGFETRKFGFGVYRKLKNGKYTNLIESIVSFNEDYFEENNLSEDDIINFYLNDSKD